MLNFFKNNQNNNYNQFTISLSYYNDGAFLKKQLEVFKQYYLFTKIQIIDDGSKEDPIEDHLHLIPQGISVFKIIEDIKWNIPGVRNLGSMITSTPWILHLDMDHIIPLESIKKIQLINYEKKKRFYSFNRKIGNFTKFTAGTLLMSIDDFWNCGGYDEDFAGVYGHNDPYLKKKLELIGVKEKRLKNIWFEDHGEIASSKLSRQNNERNKILMSEKIAKKEFFSENIRFNWKKLI